MTAVDRKAYLDARDKIVPIVNERINSLPSYRERAVIRLGYLKERTGLCVDALRTFFSSCGSAVADLSGKEVAILKTRWCEVEHNLYNADPYFRFP